MKKYLWPAIQLVMFFMSSAVVAIFLFALWRGSPLMAPASPTASMDYKDFVSIILSALAVMIAVLTIFLAIAAIWGYSQIKEEATSKAEKVAREVANDIAEPVARRTAEEWLASDRAKTTGYDYGAAAGVENGAENS